MSSIFNRQGELVDVDGIPIPKYGVLKVREVQAYNEFAKQWPEKSKGLTSGQADIEAALHCITILLQRLNPEWTIENTRAEEWTLPVGGEEKTFATDAKLIEELYKFFQGERDRWPTEADEAPSTEDEAAPGKKPTGKRSTGISAKRGRKSSAASKAS